MILSTTLSVILGLYLGWRRRQEDGTWYKLLATEANGMLFDSVGPPGLESKFRLHPNQTIEDIVRYLKDRIENIASKNPWMVNGKLKRKGFLFQPFIWVPNKTRSSTINVTRIFRVVKLKSLNDRPKIIFCKTGKKILSSQDEPLVKFALLFVENSDEYVVTLSIPHFLGGAKAVYDIWGQLDCECTETKSLILDRVDHHDGDSLCILKGEARNRLVNFMLYSDAGLFLKPPERTSGDYVVTGRKFRMNWIERRKREHKPTEDVPYLTSNDIITSWFFGQMKPPEKVMMAYDTSFRSKNVTDLHLGNYNDILLLYEEEYKDPVAIHRAVSSRGESLEKKYFPGRTIGISSSWTRYYRQVCMPHSHRLHHMQIQGYVSSGEARIVVPSIVTFQTDENQIAMISYTESVLKDYEPLGESLGWKP